MRKKIFLTAAICAILCTSGCTVQKELSETANISEQETEISANVLTEVPMEISTEISTEVQEEIAMLMELLGCDEKHAAEIAREFEEATKKQIESVELIPTETKAGLLKVQTQGSEYYLKISSLGKLLEIREGSADGKILFQVIY